MDREFLLRMSYMEIYNEEIYFALDCAILVSRPEFDHFQDTWGPKITISLEPAVPTVPARKTRPSTEATSRVQRREPHIVPYEVYVTITKGCDFVTLGRLVDSMAVGQTRGAQ